MLIFEKGGRSNHRNTVLQKQTSIPSKIKDDGNSSFDLKNKLQNSEKLIEEYKAKISDLNNQIKINYKTISLLQKQLEQKEGNENKGELNKSKKIY